MMDLEAVSTENLADLVTGILSGEHPEYGSSGLIDSAPFEAILRELTRIDNGQVSQDNKRVGAIIAGTRAAAHHLGRWLQERTREDSSRLQCLIDLCDFIDRGALKEVTGDLQGLLLLCTSRIEVNTEAAVSIARSLPAQLGADSKMALDYWRGVSKITPVCHVAAGKIMALEPLSPDLIDDATKMLTARITDYTIADAAVFLDRLARQRERSGAPERRSDLIGRVLSRVHRLFPEELKVYLNERPWTRDWVPHLNAANLLEDEAVTMASKRHPERDEFLRKLNLDLRLLRPDSLKAPAELCEALEAFWRDFDILKGPANPLADSQTFVGLADFRYPMHLDYINNDRHSDLYSRYQRIFRDHRIIGRIERLPEGIRIAQLGTERASRMRIILSVIFYFSTRRREFWRVIPVGRQTAFGCVVHVDFLRSLQEVAGTILGDLGIRGDFKSLYLPDAQPRGPFHELLDQFKDKAVDLKDSAAKLMPLHELVHGLQWDLYQGKEFAKAVARYFAQKKEAKLYCRRGFIMADLLTDMCGEDEVLGQRAMMERTEYPEPSRVWDETYLPLFEIVTNNGSTREAADPTEFSKAKRHGIAVFDLGYFGNVVNAIYAPTYEGKKEWDPGYRVFLIKHDLHVSAGLGYSLPMAPLMFSRIRGPDGSESELWQLLRDASADVFFRTQNADEVLSDFSQIGIVIDENYLPSPSTENVVPISQRRSSR